MTVDYARHAADYDLGRADERLDREYWLRAIREIGRIEPGQRILDFGAGTGRYSHLLSESNRVVALDPSRAMLHVARRKGPFAIVEAEGHHLPFGRGTFDTTVAVMVLQHLADVPAAIREIARVSCGVVIATSDMARRRLGIMEEAFPSLLQIDRARFPTIEGIAQALAVSGFHDVRVEERPYERAMTAEQQIERVRRRYLSTFDLLPPGEYERGLRFLEAELPRRTGGRFEMHTSFTFLAGSR
ncbi:MAG TPA: methyltransferase domain-containing protein [Thermoplasmata archaeon]|nr:methyltransferase domain-containing protein [Thermoplasmata archaeon]